MDTIRLGISDSKFPERLLARIRERGLPVESRNPGGEVRGAVRGYRFKYAAWLEGHHVFVAWDTWLPGASRAVVEFKISDFRSFKELRGWLECVFREDLPQVLEASVRRLDTCIDVSVPIQTVVETLYKPRCVQVSEWRQARRTFYLGARGSGALVRCYEKDVRDSSCHFNGLS
jgi:hypothetical protein